MFTKNDEKTIEKVMRIVVNEVVDEKLKPLHDFRKEATGLLEAIFDDLQEKHESTRSCAVNPHQG